MKTAEIRESPHYDRSSQAPRSDPHSSNETLKGLRLRRSASGSVAVLIITWAVFAGLRMDRGALGRQAHLSPVCSLSPGCSLVP